ncbi:unnamed protein product, partial [Ectocarpus sp. 6 AP-2014]
VVKVLADPTSAELGGRPDKPLLLVLSSAPSNPGSWATPRTPGRGAPFLAASAVGWRGTTGLPCTEVGRFWLLSTATTCAPWRRSYIWGSGCRRRRAV